MTWADRLELAELWHAQRGNAATSSELWFYRGGGFLMLNVLEDPAWLALMFC